MSIDRRPTKDARRDAAREKARAMREAAARKQRQRRILGISGGIVAALVVIALVALAVTKSGGSASAAPKGLVSGYSIVTGQASAPHTVAVYEDYQCPICKQFTSEASSWLEQQRTAGTLRLEYRPISFLDSSSSGNEYSTRSANAAWCVANDAKADYSAYNDAMYAQQPAEGANGRSDATLWSIAKKAGAGAAVQKCITGGTYRDFVTKATKNAFDVKKVTGTPTVYVDGKVITNGTDPQAAVTLADVQKALGIAS